MLLVVSTLLNQTGPEQNLSTYDMGGNGSCATASNGVWVMASKEAACLFISNHSAVYIYMLMNHSLVEKSSEDR